MTSDVLRELKYELCKMMSHSGDLHILTLNRRLLTSQPFCEFLLTVE